MKHAMARNIRVLTIGSFLFAGFYAFADGSISKAEALSQICKESKAFCSLLSVLDIDSSGSALRTRRGARVMPYEFGGRINSANVSIVIDRDENDKLTVSFSEKKSLVDGFLTGD
jgi:hypothetical protein